MKTTRILKKSIFLIMALIMAGCAQKDQTRHIIEHFRQELAGDPRENVFQIEAEKSGNKSFILRGETDNAALKQTLMDSLLNNGFTITDSILLLPEQTDCPWGIVTLSTANLRAEPRHRSELVSQALMGTPVKILKKQKYWTFIQTPDNYLSWIETAALHPLSEQQFTQWQHTPKAIVTTPFVILTDSLTGLAVSDAVMGCIIEVTSSSAALLQIKLPDGRKAIIAKEHVQDFEDWKQNISLTPQNLLATALNMNGIPYLWGGTSSKGLDCSGYTKTIYFLQGIILARDASLQVRHGEAISMENGTHPYQTGDLLFFSARPDKDSPIIHVAMYMDDDKFIHASGWVRVNSLNPTHDDYDESNTNRLAFVRRILGHENTPGIIPVKNHPWY